MSGRLRLAEDEVADTFSAALLVHVGCSAPSAPPISLRPAVGPSRVLLVA